MLLNSTAFFPNLVLAIHVIATVSGYGALLIYPVVTRAVERVDPRALPVVLRARLEISRKLVDPAMVLVVLSGIYLAFDWHLWGHFVVIFGIAVALVIGGLEGAIVASRAEKFSDLAQRDVDASGGAGTGGGAIIWSEEFQRERKNSGLVNVVLAALVVAVVYVMVVG